jgi:ribonuclease HII
MKDKSIAQIEELLESVQDPSDYILKQAKADSRKGVQALVQRWEKKRENDRLLKEKYLEMTCYERRAMESGYSFIAGIDEAGRGPLAGPVVAAAAILHPDFFLPGLDDSKKLSAKKRDEYEEIIKREALGYSIAIINPEEIDKINIYQASIKAMKMAISSLMPVPDYLLVDAVKLDTPFTSEAIIKGDAKSVSIAAASILAKTARDRLMKELSKEYPQYGFDSHMGYGTKEHLLAIEKFGITPIHRKTFAPVKNHI